MEDTSATIIPFRQVQNKLDERAETTQQISTPTKPAWLTPLASKHWDEISANLTRHRITNELDADMLAVYCSTFARYIALDEKLERMAIEDPDGLGITQRTPNGYEAETGTFTALNKLLKPIMAYAKQLGLTPPARVAMRISDPGQVDLFDEL